jgi:pyrroloquinoline quinone biosynthesis protein E
MKKIKKILREASYYSGRYLTPPEFLSLIVTFKCNFRCQMCSIWQKEAKNELNEADWLRISAELKAALPANAFVEINGGEPLLRKKLILKLILELKKYFKTVALNSNGLLINQDTINELETAGLDILKISFYSLKPETHNALRGEKLAYGHALKAIELTSKSKIKLEIGILITALNINELPELIAYLQKLPNTSLILQPLDESVESTESKDLTSNQLLTHLWPKPEEVKKAFAWIYQNRNKIKNSLANIKAIEEYYLNPPGVLKYRCFAGQRNLVIYPNGDLALCFKGKTIGNLKNQDSKTLLKKARDERLAIKNCQKYCRIIGCNFSRGLKEYFKL